MRPAVLVLSLCVSTTVFAGTEDPLASLYSGQSSLRTAGRFGIGLGAGTSTAGLSGKYFLRDSMSVQGVFGAGYGARSSGSGWTTGVGLGADLLFELPAFATVDGVEFAVGAGPGVGIWTGDGELAMAAAGVVGLELCLLDFPLDLVVEYRPRMLLVPAVAFDLFSLSGHVRYYFPTKN